MRIASELILTR